MDRMPHAPNSVQNTPSLRAFVLHKALSSFLQPRLRTSCFSSLFSGSPAAPLKGNRLPFSASPQIRPPRQLWYGFDHRHLAHSCCGCNWTVSPQGSDTDFIFTFQMVLPPWSPFNTNGFHPGLLKVSPNLLPFCFLLGPLFLWTFLKEKELSVSIPCSPDTLCQLLFSGPGGQGLGMVHI